MKILIVLSLSLLSVTSFAQSVDGLNPKYLEHQEYVAGEAIEITSPAPVATATVVTAKQETTPKNQLGEKVNYNSGVVDSNYHGQLESAGLNVHSAKNKKYNRRVEENANNSNQVNNN